MEKTVLVNQQYLSIDQKMIPAAAIPDFDCKIACPYIVEGSTGNVF